MKRLVLFLPLMAVVFLLAACASGSGEASVATGYLTPVMPPPGGIYQNIKAPLTVDFEHTPATAPKSGSATVTHIAAPFYPMLSVSFMEAGSTLTEACKNGGLSKVYYADYEVFNVFNVYTRFTVRAYGE